MSTRGEFRIAKQGPLQNPVASLQSQGFGLGQHPARSNRCDIPQSPQRLDQCLPIAQMRQAATEPAQLVVECSRLGFVEHRCAERQGGTHATHTLSRLVNARMAILTGAGQMSLRLLQ